MDRSWSRALRDARVTAAVAATDVVRDLVHRDSVGSTQDEALALLRRGAGSGLLLVTDRQLAGRGRRGRTWDDAEVVGASLALTLVIDTPPRGANLVPHAVGVAVHDALSALGVDGLVLKWPNDVLVRSSTGPAVHPSGTGDTARRRKLAGILVEREQVDGRDLLLIGVGINIGDQRSVSPGAVTHPSERHPDRTDVQELLRTIDGGRTDDELDRADDELDRAELLAGLVTSLAGRLGALDGGGAELLAAYRDRCETIGRHVDVELPDGISLRGCVTGIDEDGHLVLDADGARHVVVAATVR